MPGDDRVKIFEVAHTSKGWGPTGRQILMPPDSPLFASLGDKGRVAVQSGYLAMGKGMFEELVKIIQDVEKEGGESLKPNAQGDPAV